MVEKPCWRGNPGHELDWVLRYWDRVEGCTSLLNQRSNVVVSGLEQNLAPRQRAAAAEGHGLTLPVVDWTYAGTQAEDVVPAGGLRARSTD